MFVVTIALTLEEKGVGVIGLPSNVAISSSSSSVFSKAVKEYVIKK